jgi:ADP-ribose pyrophosphatase YjhB (NUDIX family)
VVQGVIREAREEVGVRMDPAELAFSHVIHHRDPLGQARIGFFFGTTPAGGASQSTPNRTSAQDCTGPIQSGRR